jgi:hypothetical protein
MTADEAATAAAERMFGKSEGGMPQSQQAADGGLSDKAPGKPMVGKAKKAEEQEKDKDEEKKPAPPWAKTQKSVAKAEEEDEKEEGEEEEEEGEEEEEKRAKKAEGEEDGEDMKKKKACKSDIAESDLMKALDVLEATAAGADGPVDRRAELAAKLADGTIEKAEQQELVQLLGGTAEPEGEDLDKSFKELFANDDQLKQDYEISPFIERHSQLIAEGLDFLRTSMEKSSERQSSFNAALAKSFRNIGQTVLEQADLIKSQQTQIRALSERLGVVESTPMPRKSVSGTRALAKSFDGGQAGDALSREQILEGMERLMQKSRNNNFMAPCGEPLERAVALYETTGHISKSMLGDIKAELGK